MVFEVRFKDESLEKLERDAKYDAGQSEAIVKTHGHTPTRLRALQPPDAPLLLAFRRRGALPPKRRGRSLKSFILSTVVEIRSNLVPTTSLRDIPALQPLQNNLPLLLSSSIHTRSSAHLSLL